MSVDVQDLRCTRLERSVLIVLLATPVMTVSVPSQGRITVICNKFYNILHISALKLSSSVPEVPISTITIDIFV